MPLFGPPKIRAAVAGILLLLGGAHLHAVQVYGTSGTSSAYTTAPSDDFGFANVAQVYDSVDGYYPSGVYLGNGWVLSAYHVVRGDAGGTGGFLFGSVVLDGTAYGVNAATATRITDPTTHSPADLALFQLATVPTDPKLKTLVISATAPTSGSNLILMGNGLNRADTLTYWNAAWTQTGGPSAHAGYFYGSGQSLCWGNGVMRGTLSDNDGFGVTAFLYTLFQQTNGSTMAATGDSGGGVFYKRGAAWELCAIMNTIGTLSGQPAGTSVVGDAVYAADLSVYRSQINSTAGVPTITILQGSQTAALGTPATFSVNATGFGALTCQWYKNGVAISGATGSSYTLQVTGAADAANYTVTVSGPYGSTTSSAFALTVSNPVPALPHWASLTLVLLLAAMAGRVSSQEAKVIPFGFLRHFPRCKPLEQFRFHLSHALRRRGLLRCISSLGSMKNTATALKKPRTNPRRSQIIATNEPENALVKKRKKPGERGQEQGGEGQ